MARARARSLSAARSRSRMNAASRAIADPERVDRPAQLADQAQLGVLVGLREPDVEADHLRAVSREDVDERRDLRPRPGPAPLRVQALLVDDRQRHRRRGLEIAPGADAQVVGLQLDQVEDRHADEEQRADEEHRQRRRGDDEEVVSHDPRAMPRARHVDNPRGGPNPRSRISTPMAGARRRRSP